MFLDVSLWSYHYEQATVTALTCALLDTILQALRQELKYAMHINVPAIHIELKGLNCVNLARVVSEHILPAFTHLVGRMVVAHLSENAPKC